MPQVGEGRRSKMRRMTIEDLAETFDLLGDWEERYSYLIELGRKLPPLAEAERSEEAKVRGSLIAQRVAQHLL